MPVGRFRDLTVTVHTEAIPLDEVAIMTATPGVCAEITPLASTVATDGAEEDQVILGSVAFAGETVAETVAVAPSFIVKVVLSRATPMTDT